MGQSELEERIHIIFTKFPPTYQEPSTLNSQGGSTDRVDADMSSAQEERVMQSKVIGSRVFAILGAAFLAAAIFLTIRELQLGFGYSAVAILAALAGIASITRTHLQLISLAAFGLLGVATPVIFYAGYREPSMLVAMETFFVGSLYLLWRLYEKWSSFYTREDGKVQIKMLSAVVWFSMAVSSIAFLWAMYFSFLTPLGDAFLARRLVFTFVLFVIGLFLAILGRRSCLPFLGLSGLVYLGAGVVKLVAYDTTHLDGILRIGVFAGCGLLMLIGALIAGRKGAVS